MAKDGITCHETPNDRDEAYRILATEIVKAAVEDYIIALRRPDCAEEVRAVNEMYERSVELKNAVISASQSELDGIRKRLRKAVCETAKSGLYNASYITSGNTLTDVERQLRRPLTYEKLYHISVTYQKSLSMLLARKIEKNRRRKDEVNQLVQFFKGGEFELYTGGIIDPDEVLERCRIVAKKKGGKL